MTQTKIAIGILLGAAAGAGILMLLNQNRKGLPLAVEEEIDWDGRETYNIGELSDEVKMQLEKLKAAYL